MFLNKKYIQVILHLLFWLLFVFFFNQMFDIRIRWRLEQGEKIDPANPEVITFQFTIIRSLLIGLAFKLILFYTNYYVLLKKYSNEKNLLKYFIQLLLLIAACYTTELLLKNAVNTGFRKMHLQDVDDIIAYYARINIVVYILILGFSFIYFFITEWLKNERIKSRLQAEHLSAELQLLKSQINPHFFFNTLNNLYALAQDYNNTELAAQIHTLAHLMRYMVYESNEKLVPLEKEITYIHDYLKIFDLRRSASDDVCINFKIEGEIKDKLIAPMLLIPFVENACKHGINFKEESFINIHLIVSEQQLVFSIINSNHVHEKNGYESASGLGLQNVHKRLELIYPYKYKLQIKPEQHTYEMKLTLCI
jgi:two-component system LytT family sensor kinase